MKPSKKLNLRFDWPYHFVTLPLSIAVLIASIVNLVRTSREGEEPLPAWVLMGLALCLFLAVTIIRVYATKTQDRIVRAEESFRYYRLTGRELDSRLTPAQIIALRNASDKEFPALCTRAADENWDAKRIRSSIRKFRPDTMRI
ncbi:DUF6526 family protein [Saccharibacillus kuerlensis]|uniref:ABC transporter permease n=1 Tax=Saccharibacillus kuerlensis TaxID=459527 RepID=A0ABQ2L753_9BACL|nr:DUF6526 family protein [Saccharibacillus kuerlensis]GGO05483.1 hypothetical protein GCM10010969_31910 [Saccharibacillus kuerlensis]